MSLSHVSVSDEWMPSSRSRPHSSRADLMCSLFAVTHCRFLIQSLPLESKNLGPESKYSISYYLKCKNEQVFNSLEEKDMYTLCARSQRFLRKVRSEMSVSGNSSFSCEWCLGLKSRGDFVNCGMFLCSLDHGCPVMHKAGCLGYSSLCSMPFLHCINKETVWSYSSTVISSGLVRLGKDTLNILWLFIRGI